MAVQPRTALDMWRTRHEDTVTLSSGCVSLDQILQGGFRSGLLTEICGEASAGKTQLCLQLLLQSCLPMSLGGLGGTACYISTEGVGSVKRLQELGAVYQQRYGGVLRKRRRDDGGATGSSFLDHIFVEQIYEADALAEYIQIRLPTLLDEHNTKLVVIDSIAAVFRMESTSSVKEASERSRMMFHLANCMRILSAQFKTVFVVTNQVTGNVTEGVSFSSDRSSQVKPALGLSWSNCINQRLMLHRARRGGGRTAEVMLSPYLVPAKAAFLITGTGVTSTDE